MRFGVLGPLAVWTDDGEPVAVPERKVRALLAELLTDPGRVVPADTLLEDLWGARPPGDPVGAVQTRVSRLRGALAAGGGGRDLVEFRAPGYVLRVAAEAVDAGRFASLTTRARTTDDLAAKAALLSEALGLWRGPAFADFRDEPFVRETVTRLEEQRLTALEEQADVRLELGEHGAVAADLAGPVARHPLRERLRAAHMRALYRAGRSSEALESYHALRRLLADETGLDPGPELTALYEEMLRHGPALRAAAAAAAASGGAVSGGAGRAGAVSADGRDDAAPVEAGRDRQGRATRGAWPDGAAPSGVWADREGDRPAGGSSSGGQDRPDGAASIGAGRVRGASRDGLSSPGGRNRADRAASPGARTDREGGDHLGRGRPERGGRRAWTNVVAPPTELVGRDAAVAEVGDLLAAGRLVTLTGPGGVGKTRLAVETALRDGSADGAWLVELAGRGRAEGAAPPCTDGELAETVAAALGLRDDTGVPGADATERLTEALRDKQLLLVLDNCEHIIEPAARLAEALLRGTAGTRILTTSRQPLGIAGERLWVVEPLDEPSAVRLFAARAAAVSPGFAVTDDNADAVVAICRRLDGIPLALELAAGRIRVLGAEQLSERLDDRFLLLTAGRRDAPARQQTLRAVIDWSWELLTAAERIVLRRLAVHAEGCTLPAAETVCAGDGVKPAEVLDLLARLVDRSLVVVTHGETGPRYRLLESVTAYCLERLDEAAESAAVRLAHARFYRELAENAQGGLRGGEQREWLRRLDADTANFRVALEHCVRYGQSAEALRLTCALSWYWFLRGRLGEAVRSLTSALAVPAEEGAGRSVRAAAEAWLAGFGMLTGERGSGAGFGAVADAIDDPDERARALWFLGFAACRLGDPAESEQLLTRALTAFTDCDGDWGIAAALSTRAVLRHVCGDLAGARADGERSLSLFRELGDGWGQVQATAVLGTLAEIAGDYHRAVPHQREGLRLSEGLGLWTEAARRLVELGRIALLTGDHEQAAEFHERARALALRQGDRPAQEIAEVGLGLVARRRGRLDEAEAYLRPWLEWNRRLDTHHGTALILAELGFVAELRGDAPTALALHRDGLSAARRTGDPRAVALALEGLAGARVVAGHHRGAARLLRAATEARARLGAPLPQAERGDVDRIGAAIGTAFDEAPAAGLLSSG
ncbi:BTAD domain-containing putative transcriptional regulator [Streptomyces sp. NPDC000410]|uniref:AfsR/SARP family transcriptional regulator n=1 Tax=Streptomyces sp. NPDC000410 TaxID=3154254 RepID=UPI00333226D1